MVKSAQSLAVNVSNDTALEELAKEVFKAKEVPARAPVQCAIRLLVDYTPEELECFADPNSREKDLIDGKGDPVGANRAGSVIWDKFYHHAGEKLITGSWFLDFVDSTPIGKDMSAYLDDIRLSLSKKDEKQKYNTNIEIDGENINLSNMPGTTREALVKKLNARRNSHADLYRKAIQVINMRNEIHTKLKGQIKVGWVWASDDDASLGLAKTTAPIRVMKLDINGNVTVVCQDMSIGKFINLNPDEALNKPNPSLAYEALIQSRRQKPDKTGKGQGKEKAEQVKASSTFTSKNLDEAVSNFRLFSENEAGVKGFMHRMGSLPLDKLKLLAYDLGETLNLLDRFYTPAMRDYHKEVKENSEEALSKELDRKVKENGKPKPAPKINLGKDEYHEVKPGVPPLSTLASPKIEQTSPPADQSGEDRKRLYAEQEEEETKVEPVAEEPEEEVEEETTETEEVQEVTTITPKTLILAYAKEFDGKPPQLTEDEIQSIIDANLYDEVGELVEKMLGLEMERAKKTVEDNKTGKVKFSLKRTA